MKLTKPNDKFSLTVEWLNSFLDRETTLTVEHRYGTHMIAAAGGSIDRLKEIYDMARRDLGCGPRLQSWQKMDDVARIQALGELRLMKAEEHDARFVPMFTKEAR